MKRGDSISWKTLKAKPSWPQNSLVRTTLAKLAIRGDYETDEMITIHRKRGGRFNLQWSGRVPVKSVESVKCDQGHFHPLDNDKHWVWNYCELSQADAMRIAAFFSGDEDTEPRTQKGEE